MNAFVGRRLLVATLATFFLWGCGSSTFLPEPASPVGVEPPAHALVYVIHGDGDYLYHFDGQAKHADREVLADAHKIARSAPDAEVFIFHQQSSRKVMGIFPRPDGTYYHYRSGSLIASGRYHRDPSSLGPEAVVFQRLHHPDVTESSFLYYGHDIPEERNARYHASYPRTEFGITEFRSGLELFADAGRPFDLVVLSTCNNASPRVVAEVAPYTRFILASPGDLHLSHIDSHPLHRAGNPDVDVETIARSTADWAFDRLTVRTQTSVSLTLFDTAAMGEVIQDLERRYAGIRSTITAPVLEDFVDCRDAAMPELADHPGVERWYRPPAFGRTREKEEHSGWGCPASLSVHAEADAAALR